jgi:hypothetical protein
MPPATGDPFRESSSSDEEVPASTVAATAALVPSPHPLKRLARLNRIVERLIAEASRDGAPSGFGDLVDGLDHVRTLLRTLWNDSVEAEDKLETLDSRTARLAEGTISRLVRERDEQFQYLQETKRVADLVVERERRRLDSIAGRMDEAVDRKKRGRFEFEGVVDDEAN